MHYFNHPLSIKDVHKGRPQRGKSLSKADVCGRGGGVIGRYDKRRYDERQ